MKPSIDWNDLKLFLSIARLGGLQIAAREQGISAATLSRRMVNFEDQLNRRLFQRGPHGYLLTHDGLALQQLAANLEPEFNEIERWSQSTTPQRRVRISAGDWTMVLLVQHLQEVRMNNAAWYPDFIASNDRLDIARRQVDIGIRNTKPSEPWLAGKQIGTVEFCLYAAIGSPADLPWITIFDENSQSPSALWTRNQCDKQTIARFSSAPMAMPLLLSGQGKMVLPCFIGDTTAGLEPIGQKIAALTSQRWLVMHQDERNQPAIREAITAITLLMEKYG